MNITQPKLHFDRASTVDPAGDPAEDQAAATAEAVEATTRHQFHTEARAEVLAVARVEAAEVRTEAVPSIKAPLRTTQANR